MHKDMRTLSDIMDMAAKSNVIDDDTSVPNAVH